MMLTYGLDGKKMEGQKKATAATTAANGLLGGCVDTYYLHGSDHPSHGPEIRV